MVIQEFVVDEASATLGSWPSYGLPLDHYSLNKFASPDDGNFKTVQIEIAKLYNRALVRGMSTDNDGGPNKFASPDDGNFKTVQTEVAKSYNLASAGGTSSDDVRPIEAQTASTQDLPTMANYLTYKKIPTGIWAIENVAFKGRFVILKDRNVGSALVTAASAEPDNAKVCLIASVRIYALLIHFSNSGRSTKSMKTSSTLSKVPPTMETSPKLTMRE